MAASEPPEPQRFALSLSMEAELITSTMSHGIDLVRRTRMDAYNVPAVLALLSTGAEHLLKVIAGLLADEDGQPWPDFQKRWSHDIASLETHVRSELFQRRTNGTAPGHVVQLHSEIVGDPTISAFLRAITRYAQKGRYEYLEAVAAKRIPQDGPVRIWEDEFSLAVGGTDYEQLGTSGHYERVAERVTRWYDFFVACLRCRVAGDTAHMWAGSLELLDGSVIDP